MGQIRLKAMFILAAMIGSYALIQAQQPMVIDSVYRQAKLEKSLSFAALTLGGDVLCLTGGNIKNSNGNQSIGAVLQPRLTIGGQHFWGHADFYVTFPLPLALATAKTARVQDLTYRESVETGLKIYPYAMRRGRLTPFAGISFQPISFSYALKNASFAKGEAEYNRFITPIQVGLTYSSKKYLFTAGLRYNWRNEFKFYETATTQSDIKLNALNFNIGIVRYMDTDIALARPKAIEQLNIKYAILKKYNKLDAWYCGIGPSTALQLSKSPYFKQYHPYFYERMLNSFLMPDVTFGRYFHKYDFNVGVSARAMAFKQSSFETEIKLKRVTFAIEAYKFLGNYHGFVPYIGPMLSIEHLRFNENQFKTTTTKPALGIVFGWDIRVIDTGTGLLRTNLRYTPNLNMNVKGERIMFDHLEFNFIQFIKFIGRKKVYSQHRKL
jgi:hypothetical protein